MSAEAELTDALRALVDYCLLHSLCSVCGHNNEISRLRVTCPECNGNELWAEVDDSPVRKAEELLARINHREAGVPEAFATPGFREAFNSLKLTEKP